MTCENSCGELQVEGASEAEIRALIAAGRVWRSARSVRSSERQKPLNP